jgi:ribosome-associated toxin RatA of RatAB toxin-antitoxin module
VSEIVSRRVIPLPAQQVYAAAQRVERFPDVMPNLDSVEVVENEGSGTVVTKWNGSFSLGPLKKDVSWTERDVWNEQNLSCRFDLISGDMKTYSGTWRFIPLADGGCEAELRMDFVLGIPVLGPMVNAIVDKLMQQNCDELLEALEKIARGE